MPNIINPGTFEFKTDSTALKDFGLKTLTPRLGELVGSKHFLFDIRQLDPDMFSFPYHYHMNAEELIMIISGSFTMRYKEGFRIVNQGELIFFEIGESGVHQFYNHADIPCVYLDFRTTVGLDVSKYPDSDKILILPFWEFYEKNPKVEYNTGEEKVRETWEKLKNSR